MAEILGRRRSGDVAKSSLFRCFCEHNEALRMVFPERASASPGEFIDPYERKLEQQCVFVNLINATLARSLDRSSAQDIRCRAQRVLGINKGALPQRGISQVSRTSYNAGVRGNNEKRRVTASDLTVTPGDVLRNTELAL